jgi:hypothetical protein
VQIIAKLMDVADVSTFKGNWQERALQHVRGACCATNLVFVFVFA